MNKKNSLGRILYDERIFEYYYIIDVDINLVKR